MQSKTFSGLKIARIGLLIAAFGWASHSMAAIINLVDYGISVDGDLGCFAADCVLDDTGFDYAEGLGSLDFSISGVGHHTIVLFVDHEIDQQTNTFFNEFGAVSGTAETGQTWEIDEPGWVFGDIYDNFLDSGWVAPISFLDDSNGVPAGLEDDVSMALGWDFDLLDGEIASISFLLDSLIAPGGFFLSQTDPDSLPDANSTIYFSSTLDISSVSVPEPGTAALLGAGLLGIGLMRRRQRIAAAA